MIKLTKSWRWFGEKDSVQLEWLNSNGVEEVVTALHHIPNGEIWPVSEIKKVKQRIESAGLGWSVVESLPVTEAIKTGSELRQKHIQNYKLSLKNLAECGIKTVVYNFMPVLDWARTNLAFQLSDGGESMLFDYPVFAAFDIYILKRPGAKEDYPTELRQEAEQYFLQMTTDEAEKLAHNIIVVTQGFIDGVIDPTIDDYKNEFLRHLNCYHEIDDKQLRANLAYFLNEVIPVAEEVGINLAIHPDDPPFPVLGLPRIFSTMNDLEWLQKTNLSVNNGIAFCAGSFSARKDNDVVEMARRFADRIHFVHLRNTTVLDDGSFYESGHSNGGVNMTQLVKVLQDEMQRRKDLGRNDTQIPMRPDHGIKGAKDEGLTANPGYPKFGRLKGLKEIEKIEEMIISGSV
ncbi:mannonate dehydratase [Prolixibacteraceae bacterium Z1-6]|uniref:Mannonate dehydratase n=1 Tax=Draconibacterium aestuarii TaxID=2998507 RepID=A0A9X3F6H9_9BACT|nr:mannonate dehydratase [Prolixibacteraceae bacterium Z1-6]